ncbi:LptF/LptG family permease [Verrucomicrobiota bacterium]
MDKYLLREYLIPLFFCVTTFCMIHVIWDLFAHISKFMSVHTPWRLICRYYLFVLIPTLEYVLPASLLLATLYTLWRLSRNNELTAMRASGVSMYRIMLPFLVVGAIFSINALIIKETIGPHAALWANRFSNNKFREFEENIHLDMAHYNVADRRQWLIKKFDLNNPDYLRSVNIKEEREDHSKSREITAQEAEWLDGQWWFYDGQIQQYSDTGGPVGPPIIINKRGVEMSELTEAPSVFANEIKEWQFFSSLEMINFLKNRPRPSKAENAKRIFYLHQRIALPWACFIVTLFGIPAGAKSSRQSALTGVFIAVAFFFAFYMLNQVGMFLGIKRIIAPWLGAWLSNIIFLIVGIIMTVRMK